MRAGIRGMVVGMLVGIVAQCAVAQMPQPADVRTISVSGDAEIRVKPDEVVLNLGIETNDLKLDVAKSDNDARVKRVIALAKAAGVEDKHIQTEYLSLEPRYREYEDKRVFLGYWVRRSVAVTLRDVGKFDELLTKVVEGGANYVHGIEFRTTELRKYRDEAREKAILAAREKARALTGALGIKLGSARMIEEGTGGWWPTYGQRAGFGQMGRMAMTQNVMQEGGGAGGGEEGTLAPGQIVVRANVRVVFGLE